MILPATKSTVCELVDLPHNAGEIPTAQVKLEDRLVVDFDGWMDESLADLEQRFQRYWTHNSTLDAIFSGNQRR
jgi:hypothetical protein